MEIKNFYANGSAPVFSCEFFLPKSEEDAPAFFHTLGEIQKLSPAFITLTYGAAGSARERTVETAARMRRETRLPTMMHLTGIAHTRDEIESIVRRVLDSDLNGIMALRGDPPKDRPVPPLERRDYKFGSDLVRHLRGLVSFTIGVGGYPETHPEAASPEDDLKHLQEKVDSGADFVATQLFFDNQAYFDFIKRCRSLGIKAPIVPGILPITNYQQIRRFTAMCGTRIPPALLERLEGAQNEPSKTEAIGIEHALTQCRELIARGAPGIHFYTLNKSQAVKAILSEIQ